MHALYAQGRRHRPRKAEREMIYAITHGVNYFDTAYIYPGNEAALGKLFQKGWRSRVFLATKIPHYKIRSLSDLERIFAEELSRLRTDYIVLPHAHAPQRADLAALCTLGVSDSLEQEKREGVIRHIGFSFHGGTENFKALIDT
ncbi:MAG: aldo/keto reductase [Christensenellaceae bacterium]